MENWTNFRELGYPDLYYQGPGGLATLEYFTNPRVRELSIGKNGRRFHNPWEMLSIDLIHSFISKNYQSTVDWFDSRSQKILVGEIRMKLDERCKPKKFYKDKYDPNGNGFLMPIHTPSDELRCKFIDVRAYKNEYSVMIKEVISNFFKMTLLKWEENGVLFEILKKGDLVKLKEQSKTNQYKDLSRIKDAFYMMYDCFCYHSNSPLNYEANKSLEGSHDVYLNDKIVFFDILEDYNGIFLNFQRGIDDLENYLKSRLSTKHPVSIKFSKSSKSIHSFVNKIEIGFTQVASIIDYELNSEPGKLSLKLNNEMLNFVGAPSTPASKMRKCEVKWTAKYN